MSSYTVSMADSTHCCCCQCPVGYTKDVTPCAPHYVQYYAPDTCQIYYGISYSPNCGSGCTPCVVPDGYDYTSPDPTICKCDSPEDGLDYCILSTVDSCGDSVYKCQASPLPSDCYLTYATAAASCTTGYHVVSGLDICACKTIYCCVPDSYDPLCDPGCHIPGNSPGVMYGSWCCADNEYLDVGLPTPACVLCL